MTIAAQNGPAFWNTVWVLLRAARRRAKGRYLHYQKLRYQRAGKPVPNWSGIGVPLTFLFLAIVNGLAAFLILNAVTVAERIDVEERGQLVVHDWFVLQVEALELTGAASPAQRRDLQRNLRNACRSEGTMLANELGIDRKDMTRRLCAAVEQHQRDRLVSIAKAAPGLAGISAAGALPATVGSLLLILWGLMLVCQGEGLETDTQRRRHPMWEWLFSHPVRPGAVFLAEMLSPIVANPTIMTAPLFWGILYAVIYGIPQGILAAFVVGVPLAVAAACLGKALEIAILLRFPPRTRGAMIGLMSWFGFSMVLLLTASAAAIKQVAAPLVAITKPLAVLPWPWLGLFLGAGSKGPPSFVSGLTVSWAFAAIVIAGSVLFSVWGAQRGLAGSFGQEKIAPRVPGRRIAFGKDPLYRKELLWFARDRSAVVQVVLVPLTLAGIQLFNFRGLLVAAQGSWNYIAGAAILFGTYLLFVIGPRSLASEGTALWIALTWPRGFEELLKAKARLWWVISSVIVGAILCYAAFAFPASAWQVALIGVGWLFFGRSMAEKMVTLATVTSDSGEVQRVPQGRRWATMLGMLTFAIGVLTLQWPLIIAGIVYSIITAAAMWQNFRARLPYLYDPWSETLPRPPTLMHAMIAISALVELAAVMNAAALPFAGPANAAAVRAIAYGASAVIVSLIMVRFLSGRDVPQSQVWLWHSAESRVDPDPLSLVASLALGVVGGLVLGALGLGYLALLHHLPFTADYLKEATARATKVNDLRLWLLIVGVLFAPIAEELLFRGLLYRALDGLWGGWRAILGSAAFFAIYHPALSWLPVALVGAANAALFKKTGRLAPAVALHAVYNAMVIGLG